MRKHVYLDNAATTIKKPRTVSRAVRSALSKSGSPGRGEHHPAFIAAEILYSCRSLAAELFNVDSPHKIIFTANATHALNIAINSVVRSSEFSDCSAKRRVLLSGYEHNAVMRPLHRMKDKGVDAVPIISPLFEPEVFLHKLEREMDRGASAVVCTHASNVFGYILPIERVSEMCYERNLPLIVDASQSAGCLPVDATKLKAARFICMPGHKGLLGPQGTGILICQTPDVYPLLTGGTGGDSLSPEMPDYLPERIEAGTPNVHGIAGLAEGIRYVLMRGTDSILEHEREFAGRVIEGLEMMPLVKVYGSRRFFCQTGILSISLRNGDCETVAECLARKGVSVRAGLHCAPLAHRSACTLKTGTLRISPSCFTKLKDASILLRALRECLY